MSETNPLKDTPEVKPPAPAVKQPTPTPPPSTTPAVNKPQGSQGVAVKSKMETGIEHVDKVINQVTELAEQGQIDLPKNYSLPNALKAAFLAISEAKGKNEIPALECCTPQSITKALFKMAVQGLSVIKEQGDFIVHGDQLVWRNRVNGKIALAKRYGGLKSIVTNVVYNKDVFSYEIDPATGRKKIIEHKQSMENIDTTSIDGIRGAYAIIELADGSYDMEIMNMKQIRTAWEMGSGGGASKNFGEEQARKTVAGRAVKGLLSQSDDAALFSEEAEDEIMQQPLPKQTNAQLAAKNAPLQEIRIDANPLKD